MSKAALIDALRAVLSDELAAAQRAARETAEAANHPEAQPENDKDTRKIELSYLAAGQAARARDLEASMALLTAVPLHAVGEEDAIAAGAIVRIEVEGRPQRVFLLPAGGGQKLRDEQGEVSVVTPQSPLGRGLLGKVVGESFELVLGGKPNEVEIAGID